MTYVTAHPDVDPKDRGHVVTTAPTVAIVGAGPAGIHTAAALAEQAPGARIDIYEKLPDPYGLIAHGVAPDHPDRIQRLTDELRAALTSSGARLICDVEIGTDIPVTELRARYDAVVIATGARTDAPVDLPGSLGAADFVAWYTGHPHAAPDWPLDAESVAVIGAGNVALDITRLLSKPVRALEHTAVPRHVLNALAGNAAREVHLFARRGPADTRFSPTELRELGSIEDVDVIVDPVDMVADRHMERMTRQFAPTRQVVDILRAWSRIPAADRTAERRIHLHFHRIPIAVLDTGGLRTERAVPDGYGRITGSGEHEDHPVHAVYRAIGYAGSPLPGVPFDARTRTVPHHNGAVRGEPGLYVTGWAKRGGTGLIGATRGDAAQTVRTLLEDRVRR
jgi:ferredoxin--NADP+ reductase